MTTFLVLVGFWNGVAITIGLVGALRPAARRRLARLVNYQAATAVALSVASFVLGALVSVLELPFGTQTLGAVGGFFAAVFWAAGGIVPFIVGVFLLARRRGAPDDAG